MAIATGVNEASLGSAALGGAPVDEIKAEAEAEAALDVDASAVAETSGEGAAAAGSSFSLATEPSAPPTGALSMAGFFRRHASSSPLEANTVRWFMRMALNVKSVPERRIAAVNEILKTPVQTDADMLVCYEALFLIFKNSRNGDVRRRAFLGLNARPQLASEEVLLGLVKLADNDSQISEHKRDIIQMAKEKLGPDQEGRASLNERLLVLVKTTGSSTAMKVLLELDSRAEIIDLLADARNRFLSDKIWKILKRQIDSMQRFTPQMVIHDLVEVATKAYSSAVASAAFEQLAKDKALGVDDLLRVAREAKEESVRELAKEYLFDHSKEYDPRELVLKMRGHEEMEVLLINLLLGEALTLPATEVYNLLVQLTSNGVNDNVREHAAWAKMEIDDERAEALDVFKKEVAKWRAAARRRNYDVAMSAFDALGDVVVTGRHGMEEFEGVPLPVEQLLPPVISELKDIAADRRVFSNVRKEALKVLRLFARAHTKTDDPLYELARDADAFFTHAIENYGRLGRELLEEVMSSGAPARSTQG